METYFGIIPYPKYDEEQKDYCARVSYYMPPMIPITNTNLELVGAVLEEANYRAKKNITPAYYDITLKGKYSRDPESISMLDLIFSSRVIDLGDTLFCSNVRDGFVSRWIIIFLYQCALRALSRCEAEQRRSRVRIRSRRHHKESEKRCAMSYRIYPVSPSAVPTMVQQ